MKRLGLIGATFLSFMLLAIPRVGYARQPQSQDPQSQDKDKQQQKQNKNKEQQRGQQPQRTQERPPNNARPQQQRGQQPQRTQQRPPNNVRPQQQRVPQQRGEQQRGGQQGNRQRPAQIQRTPQRQRQWQQEQHSAWQQHRASHWESEHRDWRQRGGYHGYRISGSYYRLHYGRAHWFRIYSLPFLVVGGYPRFQYGGYWFDILDPIPQYWGPDWYETDDCYIEYTDGGYYLFDRRYPRYAVAVSISF
ncbi:MAG TPA: hypothetical protein VN785_02980 [Candidatus Angelobacter sp.]|nr:hypothetical protein [Candidatus Angelobacter sp.]